MQEKSNTQPKMLYEDQFVQITDKSVKVLKFYYPQDCKNQIEFKDIKKLALKQMDEMDQTLGVDSIFFKDFNKRMEANNNMYIQMAIQDESVVLSFAPLQPHKAMKIIEQKWEETKIEKESQAMENNLYANIQINPDKIQQAINFLHEQQKRQSKQTGHGDNDTSEEEKQPQPVQQN